MAKKSPTTPTPIAEAFLKAVEAIVGRLDHTEVVVVARLRALGHSPGEAAAILLEWRSVVRSARS